MFGETTFSCNPARQFRKLASEPNNTNAAGDRAVGALLCAWAVSAQAPGLGTMAHFSELVGGSGGGLGGGVGLVSGRESEYCPGEEEVGAGGGL